MRFAKPTTDGEILQKEMQAVRVGKAVLDCQSSLAGLWLLSCCRKLCYEEYVSVLGMKHARSDIL